MKLIFYTSLAMQRHEIEIDKPWNVTLGRILEIVQEKWHLKKKEHGCMLKNEKTMLDMKKTITENGLIDQDELIVFCLANHRHES